MSCFVQNILSIISKNNISNEDKIKIANALFDTEPLTDNDGQIVYYTDLMFDDDDNVIEYQPGEDHSDESDDEFEEDYNGEPSDPF